MPVKGLTLNSDHVARQTGQERDSYRSVKAAVAAIP